jgi:hypothetical protein
MKRFTTTNTFGAATTIYKKPTGTIRTDPLRRFAPTPHTANLSAMGKCVQFETNRAELCEYLRELLSVYPPVASQPEFRWRVIVEPSERQPELCLTRFAFSEPGFRYASFGQRNFIALDLASRLGIAYIGAEIAKDRRGMLIRVLDTLFCMTASSLGFVSLFANSVEVDGRGILLMGPPRSGKTTASYLASKAGMSLHADEGVFLELTGNELAGWGGFWPLIFREETLQFLPELGEIGEPFLFGEFSFCHVDKRHLQTQKAGPVSPKLCIFLHRQAVETVRISPLSTGKSHERLRQSLLFVEDDEFRLQTAEVLAQLSALPGYEVSYGSDPAAVVPILQELMAAKSPNSR